LRVRARLARGLLTTLSVAYTYIFPGRFQPPHNDHVALVDGALDALNAPGTIGCPLYLGLIVHAPDVPAIPGATAIDRQARPHHEPARNPFSFAERRAMWRAVYANRTRAPIVIPLPRPEAGWPWIVAAFPGPRCWIVPDQGEALDDAKAAFFVARGDRVVRPALVPSTDGRRVRALLGDPARLRQHVPQPVADVIATLGPLNLESKGITP
jgi:nicotinamide mononucleotide adenylyltransferase